MVLKINSDITPPAASPQGLILNEKITSPSIMTKIVMIWESALIHWGLGTAASAVFAFLSVTFIALASFPIAVIYGIVAVVSYLYARHQRKCNSVKFWAEESQLFTNFFKYRVRNLTKQQAKTYEMGKVRCFYHPVSIKDKSTLFQGAQPSNTFGHFNALKEEHGVRVIINVTEDKEEEKTLFSTPITTQQWKDTGLIVYRFPVPDFSIPTLEVLTDIVSTMKDHLSKDEGNVYIHCMSGMGRSSVPTLAYMISQGDTLGGAKESLLARRCQVNIDKEKMNQLLWDYLKGTKADDYSLSEEITKRFNQLDKNLSFEKKRQILGKEYKGIEGLEGVLNNLLLSIKR